MQTETQTEATPGLELLAVRETERGLEVEYLVHGAMYQAPSGRRTPAPLRTRDEVRIDGDRVELWHLWPTGVWKRAATGRVLASGALSTKAPWWHRWTMEQAIASLGRRAA
jgi:hypothetical protein